MTGPASGSRTTWLTGDGASTTAAPAPGKPSADAPLLRIATTAGRDEALSAACLPDVSGDGLPMIPVLDSAYGWTVETTLNSVLTAAASSGSKIGDELSSETA